MIPRLALLAALMLGACAAPGGESYYSADHRGNVYPPECRRDLSHLTAPVVYASARDMGYRKIGTLRTIYRPGLDDQHIIFVRDDLSAADKASVIHHERCHIIAGDFHR